MSSEVVGYDPDQVAQTIYHLRKIGNSFPEIQKSLSYDDIDLTMSQVVSLFRGFQKSLSEAYGPEERAQLLGLELERLDDMQGSWWAAAQHDKDAAGVVLKIMSMRHKLLGLDIPDGTDRNVQQTVLVIGNNTQEWIEALEHGQANPGRLSLPGAPLDDGGVPEEATP
jgi:hypothetical protein